MVISMSRMVAAVLLAAGVTVCLPPITTADDSKDAVRDAVQDANRDQRDTALEKSRQTREEVRDAARELRTAPADKREAAREKAQRARDNARDARANLRQQRQRTLREMGIDLGSLIDRGLAIADSATDGIGHRAGLRKGDYVVSVNDQPVKARGDFERMLFAGPRDQRVKVVVFRDGREETIFMEPSALYSTQTADPDLAYFGVVLDDQHPDRIVIRTVTPGTPAATAGLRANDEITVFHGTRIATPREFVQMIRGIQPGTVDFEYVRDSKTMRAQAKFERRDAKTDARQETKDYRNYK